jgi:ABC-type multidrug transport system ATPase subunit
MAVDMLMPGEVPAVPASGDGSKSDGATTAGIVAKGGTCVTFQNVAFSLPGKRKKDPPVQILENVTGFFAPGTLTATMGPSGAGKTTFLDIVTGRKNRGHVEGELLYDGKRASNAYLKRNIAYVEQFDTLLGVLTVRKMLLYQAELKCSRREPLESKRDRVESLLVKLGLEGCADVPIGDALHPGISGGQAKRTNIGIALVTEPRVIFLDEPTSGLDSMTSLDIVTILRRLAKDQGVTIMSTIHSPTSEAFRLFDNVLLLVKGRTVFFGPLHGQSGVVNYFDTLGLVFDPTTNLADFLIRETGNSAEIDFAGSWSKSGHSNEVHDSLKGWLKDPDRTNAAAQALPQSGKEFLPHNGLTSISVLLKYRTSANYKCADFMAPRLSPMVIFGFIIGSLYYGVGSEAESTDPLNVKARGNIAAALFMCTALPSFTASGYMPSIVSERPLFYRETNDGCYSAFSYTLYKLLEEAVPQVVGSLIFCALTSFLIEFKGHFAWQWLIFFVTGQTGIALAYVCASVARNMDEANTLLPVYNVLGMFFTGVLFTYEEIPTGWRWYTWTCFVRYAWSAHMVNNFGDKCEEGPESHDTPACPIEYWGIDVGSAGTEIWKNFAVLCLCWLFFVSAAWFTMANVRHVRR